MIILWKLFYSFARIGSFAIGGGYVILPLLLQESLDQKWMTQDQFVDMLAVSQITPGPIAINMATYVGYHMGGVGGSLTASFAVVLPSFTLLMFLAIFFFHFYESKFAKSIFYGLRPTVTGLIAAAAVQIGLISILDVESVYATNLFAAFDWKACLILLAAVGAIWKWDVHPIILVIAAGAAGIAFL
jgi:chromate transporter